MCVSQEPSRDWQLLACYLLIFPPDSLGLYVNSIPTLLSPDVKSLLLLPPSSSSFIHSFILPTFFGVLVLEIDNSTSTTATAIAAPAPAGLGSDFDGIGGLVGW